MAILNNIQTVRGHIVSQCCVGGQHFVTIEKDGLEVYFKSCASFDNAERHFHLQVNLLKSKC